ncbi:hypothetical protein DPMN_039189 [Dreissena polymorpha]|uniref:Uncharacterized protein n=1 Tax=Dreissena polymorpha TaxID=45954 RepID=A0A9D4MIF6_DREPO|nr:hypothetical protein DPMN_039189 [Dreissena polymorpha]
METAKKPRVQYRCKNVRRPTEREDVWAISSNTMLLLIKYLHMQPLQLQMSDTAAPSGSRYKIRTPF